MPNDKKAEWMVALMAAQDVRSETKKPKPHQKREALSHPSWATVHVSLHRWNYSDVYIWVCVMVNSIGVLPCVCPGIGISAWPSSPFSHNCMRINGSLPFCVSLLQCFGRESMSLTLPWERPSTCNPHTQEIWYIRFREKQPWNKYEDISWCNKKKDAAGITNSYICMEYKN